MKKILYIIFLFIVVANCSFKPVVKHHGVRSLEKKQNNLKINISNKNDIIKILGNPSTTSKFKNDVWIYIERQQTQSRINNLGKLVVNKNDVLVLEIDRFGVLKKKEYFNKNDMQKIAIAKDNTKGSYEQTSFIYNFMASMRQKMNDPLGTRSKKREAISQR